MLETKKTTRIELQEQLDTPQVQFTSLELLNNKNLQNNSNPIDDSKLYFHLGCGNNLKDNKDRTEKSIESFDVSMSDTNNNYNSLDRVFVLSNKGNPLTPCKPAKARKLLIGGVARVVWNKFGQFGIQLLVLTREETPKMILGIDGGTKFEGYSIVTNEQNNLNIMWKLFEKRTIAKKLEERRHLRRARRWRNCRRRICRFNNRNKEGFIAPSQFVIVNSRLKCIKELFKCYPISKVVFEDVKFNHKKNKWGKNFSTIEIGKTLIKKEIVKLIGKRNKTKVKIKLVKGYDTFKLLEKYGLRKNKNKSQEDFYTHNIDSFIIASEEFKKEQKGFMERIGNKINEDLIVIDDTYRPTRRKLHDTQPSKNGIRANYSTGNFRGIRKGTICEYGQIVGGTKNNVWIRNSNNKRIGKDIKKIKWLSHNFKIKNIKGGVNSSND